MIGLCVDIYEEDDERPVVTHIFWGETQREVEEVFDAHRETDDFLDGAIADEFFEGIHLRVEERWLKAGDRIEVED